MPDQNPAESFEVGAFVRCARFDRLGRIRGVLAQPRDGRRYWVQWKDAADYSLVRDGEISRAPPFQDWGQVEHSDP